MSSYGFYLFVDAVKDLIAVLAPVLVAIVLAVAALLAWRRYLVALQNPDCVKRIEALEARVLNLERERRSSTAEEERNE